MAYIVTNKTGARVAFQTTHTLAPFSQNTEPVPTETLVMKELRANGVIDYYGSDDDTADATDLIQDNMGVTFSPNACTHVYTYDGFKLLTDTATKNGVVRRKTFSYTGDTLTGESQWVVQ